MNGKLRKMALDATGGSLMAIGVLLIVAAFCIPVWQSYHWLRYGIWVQLDIATICDWINWFPQVRWLGAQEIITWLLSWPLSLAVFGAGFGALLAGGPLEQRARNTTL
jgi:hypothetical protein